MPAKIEPPALPIYLYRYRSLHRRAGEMGNILAREIETLRRSYIWCSKFIALNDPMEGFYRPSSAIKKKSNYVSDRGVGVRREERSWNCEPERHQENELMWTHYAGNYSGICIEYYADRLRNGLPDSVSLVRLGYDERPPRLTKSDLQNRQAAHKILSQKKFNWSYEREWRLLGEPGKVKIDDRNCVRAVYFGSRIAPAYRSKLVKELKKRKISADAMDVDGYRHVWKPLYQAPATSRMKQARISGPAPAERYAHCHIPTVGFCYYGLLVTRGATSESISQADDHVVYRRRRWSHGGPWAPRASKAARFYVGEIDVTDEAG